MDTNSFYKIFAISDWTWKISLILKDFNWNIVSSSTKELKIWSYPLFDTSMFVWSNNWGSNSLYSYQWNDIIDYVKVYKKNQTLSIEVINSSINDTINKAVWMQVVSSDSY